MQFQYGGYRHDVNSVAFTGIQRQFMLGQGGRPSLLRVTFDLKGKLVRSSQGAIMGALSQLVSAYSVSGLSAGMLDNNGGLIGPWFIDTTQALGGVQVTKPISHGPIQGAEGNTYLNYSMSLTADFSAWTGILSFSEQVTFTNNNGGPLQVERLPATGDPLLQSVTEKSFFYATQSGQMTQFTANPQPMIPIWPDLQRRKDGTATVSLLAPKTIRGIPIEYGVQWKYEFISISPIIGFPNIRG